MAGRSVHLTTLTWAGLDLLSGSPVLRAYTFASNWQLPFLKKRKEKRKYVARPGFEPRTPDLRVRCPTDCATRPGGPFSSLLFIGHHAGSKFTRTDRNGSFRRHWKTINYIYARPAQSGPIRTRLCRPCVAVIYGSGPDCAGHA